MTEQEKKRRIAELRAELKKLQATPRSDWHTAFEAFLRFKTYKYKSVSIQSEVGIGSDVPRTDYVILTDDGIEEFEEAIFRIFRKVNILEYKNPHDSLNKRVLYKIAGYANLLIGTAEHEGDVPEDQVTISIFRSVKNPKLFKEMEGSGELEKTETPGVYRVIGISKLPFQIVLTSELRGAEYAACRALTDKADELDVERVMEELEREPNERIREYYGTFLNLIAEKNPEVFAEIRRESKMKYPGLMKVFADDVAQERRDQEQQTLAVSIKNLMSNLKLTLEQAMDALSIPQAQRAIYAGLVQAGK